MCAQKTAPRKTASVETLRNDAMDWLAVQIARPREYASNPRLKRHLRGPLGSANEVSLRSFFKRAGDRELYLTFDSMNELVKFDRLLTNSGLFENIDCVYTKRDDGKLDVTVTLDQRELTLAQARKLLGAKEEKLLEIARKEGEGPKEFTKGMDELATIVEGALESSDPLAGGIPMRTEDLAGSEPVEMPPKGKEGRVMPLPKTIVDSDGDSVPLIPDKKVKRKLEKAIESGERFAFVVKGGSRVEKFLDEGWLSQHGIDGSRVDIEKKGKRSWKITINGEMSSEAEIRARYESILRELQGEA